MAATDRLLASDITLTTLGGTSYVDKLRAISGTESPTRVATTCIKDTYRQETAGIIAKEYAISLAPETTGAFRALIGTRVAYTIDLTGNSETGTGTLFDLTEDAPLDGAQEERIVLSVDTVD